MRRLIVVTALAVLAVPAAPALAQRATAGYVVRTTTMRAGPDYDYPAVRRVGRNVRVDIYGCLRDRSWCDAGYRSDRGWIPGRDLVADYRGRRQNIALYPGIGILSFIFGSYWDSHYRTRNFYAERPRWERQYHDNYQTRWGPQTPPAYQQPNRRQSQPPRPGVVGRPLPATPPQPQRVSPPQPQPRPRATEHRTAPVQVVPPQPQRRAAPDVAPAPGNPPPPNARRTDPARQPAPAEHRGGKKGKGEKQP
jgi:uncharacterized protein YraI